MDWEALARANTHPLRVSIMEVLHIDGGRTLSPKDLSRELQAALTSVNYHITALRKSGLVEIVREVQVRGAIEHFYRPVKGDRKRKKNGGGRNANRKGRGKAGKKPRRDKASEEEGRG